MERAIGRLFLGGWIVNLLALGWFMLRHGHARGYRFEIAGISVDWLVLLISAFLMSSFTASGSPPAQPQPSRAVDSLALALGMAAQRS